MEVSLALRLTYSKELKMGGSGSLFENILDLDDKKEAQERAAAQAKAAQEKAVSDAKRKKSQDKIAEDAAKERDSKRITQLAKKDNGHKGTILSGKLGGSSSQNGDSKTLLGL